MTKIKSTTGLFVLLLVIFFVSAQVSVEQPIVETQNESINDENANTNGDATFCISHIRSCSCIPGETPDSQHTLEVKIPQSDETKAAFKQISDQFKKTIQEMDSLKQQMEAFEKFFESSTVVTTIAPNCPDQKPLLNMKTVVQTDNKNAVNVEHNYGDNEGIKGQATLIFKLENDGLRDVNNLNSLFISCKNPQTNQILKQEAELEFNLQNSFEQKAMVPYPSVCEWYLNNCKNINNHNEVLNIQQHSNIDITIHDCNHHTVKTEPIVMAQVQNNDHGEETVIDMNQPKNNELEEQTESNEHDISPQKGTEDELSSQTNLMGDN